MDPEKVRFRDEMVRCLNQVAPVTARGMFGGYGLYCEGVMFALIAYNTLYFKVDDGNRQDYIDAGMGPFVYEGKGKPIQMSYYQLPETVLNEVPLLAEWVEKSHAAGRRAKQGKKGKRQKAKGRKQIQD
ncbi:MAG: TfoX/Sxy family protein [Leptolyngbya sp. SIO1D8]|nr:TfoX/Sxy family protein [Leptolyngbya sp. SIO1D8]